MFSYFTNSNIEIDQKRVDNDQWYVFDISNDKRTRDLIKRNGIINLYRRRKLSFLYPKTGKNLSTQSGGGGVVQSIVRYFSPPDEFDAKISNNEINKSDMVYEVIVKNNKDFEYFLHLFFGNLSQAENIFDALNRLLTKIECFIIIKNLSSAIYFYQELMLLMRDNCCYSALHFACALGIDGFLQFNDTSIMMNLNENYEPFLLTPLHLAIKNKQITIVKKLINFRSDLLDNFDKDGNTGMHFAVLSIPEILEFILKIENKDKTLERLRKTNFNGYNPFIWGCINEKCTNVTMLIKYELPVSCMTASKVSSKGEDIVVRLNDKQISALDMKSIVLGGSPLHWTGDRELTDYFVRCGFDVNAKNDNGETALIFKMSNKQFASVIPLLFGGADPNIVSTNGDTALTYAIKHAHITMVQALIVFDADVNHVNQKNGHSLRHIVASYEKEPYNRILHLLYSMDARRCSAKQLNCKKGCKFDGSFNGIRAERWNSSKGFSGRKPFKTQWMHSIFNDMKIKNKFRNHKKYVNMLTLDGGGIRGLVSLQCLSELQRHLKHPLHEYFEWIAGTSTGSMIACALALGKSITELRSLYFHLKDQVFTGSPPYSSETLESIIKSIAHENLVMSDLLTQRKKYVMFATSLVDRYPPQLFLFRSYDMPGKLPNVAGKGNTLIQSGSNEPIWKAVRASASAPLYFSNFGPFLDGGLFAGNPAFDFYLDFYRYNHYLRSLNLEDECKELNILLSVGTGEIVPSPYTLPEVSNPFSFNPSQIQASFFYIKEMCKLVYKAASATDYHINDRMETTCAMNNIPFIRLNPEMQDLIALNETQDSELFNVLYMTKVYMYENTETVEDLVQILEEFHFKKYSDHLNKPS